MEIEIIVDDDSLRIERLELGSWPTNAYIVVCPQTGSSTLIDVPPGARTLVKNLQRTNLQYMLLTHNHIDHIAGLQATRDRIKAPLAVHAADNKKWLPFPPEILLNDGDVIRVGNIKIETIHTPGHTPGSMCFKIRGYLICGDTIFPGGPGSTVSPSDFREIVKSITGKIFTLPDDTKAYPGHGGPTILKKEKEEFTIFSSRPHDPKLCGDVVWLSS
jgi:hydroxyacylglutathione hydrolase